MRICLRRLLFTVLWVALPVASFADETSSSRLDQLLASMGRGQHIGQVAISPDGKRLAWIDGGRGGGRILVAPLGNLAKSRSVTAAPAKAKGGCREGQPRWTPDSSALIFLSNCAASDGQSDFYLDRLDGVAPRRLTHLKGEADDPAVSPDGKQLAFLYVPGATRPAGALAAMKAPSGVIGEDGIEIQRIATVAVAAAASEPMLVTPAALHIYEFDWAPDSKAVAYVAAEPPGENNWWVAKLYAQALSGQPKAILAPSEVEGPLHGLQIAVPRWSPDGKSIAFVGGLMSDQGSTGGDLWLISAEGGQPVDLTPNRPSTPVWLTWESPSRLWATELAGGSSRLVGFELSGAPARATEKHAPIALPGAVGAGGFSLSLSPTADRAQFVFSSSSFEKAPEIYTVKTATAEVRRISSFNSGLKPEWGKSVSLDWTNEGFHVQGWLLEPKNFDPAKKYPMIVMVHGGPSAAAQSYWGGRGSLSATTFSALGYFVLLPNPRGSFGQGEAFTQANRKDFGYGDLRDILAGVDTVLTKYPVDPQRVGLTGWSYGGFMTMFAVTQTHRFRAAVAGAGISNWQSYYGENSIDQWMIPFFGASVYDDPAVYAKSSAINFIKQAKTPTLVVVGDRDGECPAPQSFEFWHALRAQHVPTQLVVYPNEGHGFVNPAHSRDVFERAIDWFGSKMPPTR